MDQLSRADQVKVLRDFLSGEISSASLRGLVAGHISIEGDWGSFTIEIAKPLEVQITVTPEDLRPYNAYLQWSRSREWIC